MTPYEQMQRDLDSSLREMYENETRAASVISSIATLLQKEAGFPGSAFTYRDNPCEPTEQSSPFPQDKIKRGDQGTWQVTMDIRVDASNAPPPIQLPRPSTGAHSFTYMPLDVQIIDADRIRISFGDNSSSGVVVLSTAGANQRPLADFCALIRKRIEGTIRWVATGEGNPLRRMGFHG